MKFPSAASLSSLIVLASASLHIQEIAVTCTVADLSTVYQTVTVTSTVYNRGSSNHQYTFATPTFSTERFAASSSVTSSTLSTLLASSTISTTAKATHSVVVGANGELKYGPNQLNAAIGDIIRFDFNSTNHTVTQSSFNAPCSPLAGGFNTAFHQVNKLNHTGVIFVDFEVNVDTPLWFYCAQTVKTSHCHKGMVLGINPAGKFPAFLDLATATASGTAISTSNSAMPMATGGRGGSSNAASETAHWASPKPTATVSAYRFKGRQAAAWHK